MINTQTLEVAFSKGGHPAASGCCGQDGKLEFPEAVEALLGIFPDEQFEVTRIKLVPGDRLFVYSDGIEVGFCGEDIADNQRWQDELYRRRSLSTDKLLYELAAELDRQSGSLQPKDDLTVIAIEVKAG